MSADLLRRAAALMRERAEAATPGPWSGENEHGNLPDASPAWCISRMRPGYQSMGPTEGYLYDVAEIVHDDDRSEGDCHHIASWDPTVALAVAELLDEVAGWREEGLGLMPLTNLADAWNCIEQRAFAVARAYLGSES